MSKLCLNQYLGFEADRRLSMEIYAQALSGLEHDLRLNVVRPRSVLENFSASRLVMRYLRYWHYPRMVRNVDVDLHHILDHGYAHLQPSLTRSSADAKTCVTVHDLIPLLTWNGTLRSAKGEQLPTRKPILNLHSLSFISNFDRVLTISQSTKADLIKHLSIDAEKIDVIPPVIDQVFQAQQASEVVKFAHKYGLDRRYYWIMISGSEFYKNHRTSLEVLARLNLQHDSEFRLVKTGLPSDDFDAMVGELGLRACVKTVWLDTPDELALLYGMVDCLLFPSLYEGFGMPVAEALACGTAVVCSDRGSLPEVGGELVPCCDAGDVQSLAKQVASLVFEPDRRQEIAQKGPRWVEQYRVPAIEPQLRAFYSATLNNR